MGDLAWLLNIVKSPGHRVLRHFLWEHYLCISSIFIGLPIGFRAYRLIHRYLGRGGPLKVSDSVAIGKISLLYLAVSTGHVAAVDDLLSIGIDIDGEFCDEDTALTIASVPEQLDVVKYLVRRRARLFYQPRGSQENRFTFKATCGKEEVFQWLLVNPYTDQAKITNTNSTLDGEDKRVKESTGLTQFELPIEVGMEKAKGRDYARALRGEVMNLTSEESNQREKEESADEDGSSGG
ncbi:hypothetical protein RRF57_005112 [Xylaria bambusicola]|uniref:Uncharacterized protein n=1 Tax=Xylaria bambusicola TaxID=326684 RepID=A0AAN7UJ93_9PEZI